MGIESLDQKIAKQQEKLNQLKAQKQAALAREKAKLKKIMYHQNKLKTSNNLDMRSETSNKKSMTINTKSLL